MRGNFDRLIDIIEDHNSMEIGLRVIQEALESGELPKEGTLPAFNDGMVNEIFVGILQKITGEKYK